jgi:hypothetical protein
MRSKRSRFALGGFFLATTLAVALTAGGVAGAKPGKQKGKGGPSRLEVTKQVGLAIPDAIGQTDGVLVNDINAGGKYRGKKIRDVNVTVQTNGTGPDAAGDLRFRLTAPNGATTNLFAGLAGVSIGPLTLDDESPFELGDTVAHNGFELVAPYNGVAMPANPLVVMDNGGVKGKWTLTAVDRAPGGPVSSLLSWRLTVAAGKPFLTR